MKPRYSDRIRISGLRIKDSVVRIGARGVNSLPRHPCLGESNSGLVISRMKNSRDRLIGITVKELRRGDIVSKRIKQDLRFGI